MQRVPVIDKDGKPLMPTKASRSRRMVRDGKAVGKRNKLGIYYIQLVDEPSGREKQDVSVGLDPGKFYSGIGLVSRKVTLFTTHVFLPFETVKKRMEQRAMMRRSRRGRRINRKIEFSKRAHRQKRFLNRRNSKLAPSIKSNRQLEIKIISLLSEIYPITSIIYEYLKADVDLTSGRKSARSGKGFSPVMVGQTWAIKQLNKIAPVVTKFGWQTSNLRKHLGLSKQKLNKKEAVPATHAVDGLTLAASQFIDYLPFENSQGHGHCWQGKVQITDAPFFVIRRPPISRRQLHLMIPTKGGRKAKLCQSCDASRPVAPWGTICSEGAATTICANALRRKYGGTTTRHQGIRKGDFVEGMRKARLCQSSPDDDLGLRPCAGIKYQGWCSGDTAKQISISNVAWKRIGQFTASKVRLLRRATGLICTRGKDFNVAV